MAKWTRRVIITAFVVGAAVWGVRALLAPSVVQVRVAAVDAGPVELTVTNFRAGTVKARQRAELGPERAGRVVAVACREGDRVKSGQLLLQLDEESVRAEWTLAKRGVEAAEARGAEAIAVAARAERELERFRRMAAEKVISADRLDELEAAYDVARARRAAADAEVARARAALEVADAELKKTRIVAPFDGVVAEMNVEIGEWVTPSPPGIRLAPIIDVLDPSSVYISAPMDEVDCARLASGQKVRVSVDPIPGRSFTARLARVAPYVLDLEKQNRTVDIEVELDDRTLAATLLPGTSADVEVILQRRESVVRIPAPALMEGNRVLVVEGDVLVSRRVEIGLRNWDFVEITSGLERGEAVVVSLDAEDVRAGARVRIEDESPQP